MENIPHQTCLNDFVMMENIGKGAYGRVSLVMKKSNGKLYALKSMSKDDLFRKNMASQIINERNTLALSDCFFIVPLFYSFETEKEVHLIMEYMSGGDFGSIVKHFGFLNEDTAKFYISEACVALSYLHKKNIIHRDIKPSNFLMSSSGHLKLADFGLVEIKRFRKPEISDFKIVKNDLETLQTTPKRTGSRDKRLPRTPGQVMSLISDILGSKENVGMTESNQTDNPDSVSSIQPITNMDDSSRLLGTPDYFAPEVILKHPYDYKIDWWALGICLYEMVCGFPPFNDVDVHKIFENILNHDILFPTDDERLSKNVEDAILTLLDNDPHTRADFDVIIHLEFFCDVDWVHIEKMRPPLIPSNFK